MCVLQVGFGSYEVASKRQQRNTYGGKLKSLRYPSVVAENFDGQGTGAERPVSRSNNVTRRTVGRCNNRECWSNVFH